MPPPGPLAPEVELLGVMDMALRSKFVLSRAQAERGGAPLWGRAGVSNSPGL